MAIVAYTFLCGWVECCSKQHALYTCTHRPTCTTCIHIMAVEYCSLLNMCTHTHTHTHVYLQSSLAQLGIPLTDVVKVLVATLLLGNVLFYEAKNQELSMQGLEGSLPLRLIKGCMIKVALPVQSFRPLVRFWG